MRIQLLQDSCGMTSDCSHYSYDYLGQICYYYGDCPDLTETFCPNCVSGQPGCGVGK